MGKKPKSNLTALRPRVAVPYSLRTPWRDALRLELSRADGPQGVALDRIARIVVHNALNGDMGCIAEIANRLDGKTAIQDTSQSTEQLQKLVVEWGGKIIDGKG